MLTRRALRVLLGVLLGLLLATLLAGWGVVAVAGPALACPVDTGTTTSHTKQASDVFTGTIQGRHVDNSRVVFDVRVERIYKGGIDSDEQKVSTFRSARGCGVSGLQRDKRYVFFATGDGAALKVGPFSGTASATDQLVSEVEALLGHGRTPIPPEPDTATFTLVAGEPTSLERLAAPGLALVIVGVLGLGLAVGLSRRRA